MFRFSGRLKGKRVLTRLLPGLLMLASCAGTLGCEGDETVSTVWSGSYNVSDEFGGGSGTVTFVVTAQDTVFCFSFSGNESAYSTSCQTAASGGFPINNNQFSIPLQTSQGAFILQGRFASSTRASGGIIGTDDPQQTVLTWSATTG
jgi:hypothetical protein